MGFFLVKEREKRGRKGEECAIITSFFFFFYKLEPIFTTCAWLHLDSRSTFLTWLQGDHFCVPSYLTGGSCSPPCLVSPLLPSFLRLQCPRTQTFALFHSPFTLTVLVILSDFMALNMSRLVISKITSPAQIAPRNCRLISNCPLETFTWMLHSHLTQDVFHADS